MTAGIDQEAGRVTLPWGATIPAHGDAREATRRMICGSLRVTQVVNVRRGVHMFVPKLHD